MYAIRSYYGLFLQHDTYIAVEARFANVAFGYSLLNGATGLVQVGAIYKAAILRYPENLREVQSYLRLFYIDQSKTSDSRSINNVGVGIQRKHFVITSYSIHYTKLYDAPTCTSPVAPFNRL